MNTLKNGLFVDKAIVLTLPRRQDRLNGFFSALPAHRGNLFAAVDVMHGCDGKRLGKSPDFTRETAGCWGCRQSHLRILEMAASHQWQRVLVFEDDADVSMIKDNLQKMTEFLSKVPDEWDLLQLGYFSGMTRTGIDLYDRSLSAVCLTERAVRTHALIYNGKSAAKIYDLVWTCDAKRIEAGLPIRHIDQTLNQLAATGHIRRYVPPMTLIKTCKAMGSDIRPYRKGRENRR